ncbi:hypothetical protein GIB67_042790, partial [Kingdonia uniflora]
TSDRSGKKALKTFREALDNYKLEYVVWDPYLEKRADRYVFKKVASFTGFIRSPEHVGGTILIEYSANSTEGNTCLGIPFVSTLAVCILLFNHVHTN